MNFQQYDLGFQQRGSVVQVTLVENAANVQLLDSPNLQNYKAGRRFTYYGGHHTSSPVRITIPHAGTWYVVVDLGGYRGHVRSSVRMIN